MNNKPDFDLTAAHKYFAADCFNRAWDLIDRSDRSVQDDLDMLHLSMASLWHWTQREDSTSVNLSVGYWQLARIYALLGQAENARRYGQLCLESAQAGGDLPFYLGYAYEALARAVTLAGDSLQAAAYLTQARQAAARIPDPADRKQLLADLDTIG